MKEIFLKLFCCGKNGIDSKTLKGFFTPAGRPALLRVQSLLCNLCRTGFSSIRDIPTRKIKKAASCEAAFSILVADRTGLEPATSGVTGRHSNQLNYRSAKAFSLGGWYRD